MVDSVATQRVVERQLMFSMFSGATLTAADQLGRQRFGSVEVKISPLLLATQSVVDGQEITRSGEDAV